MWKMKLRAKLGKAQGLVLQRWARMHKDIFIVLDARKVRMYLFHQNRKESLVKHENKELLTYMQFLTICQVCP